MKALLVALSVMITVLFLRSTSYTEHAHIKRDLDRLTEMNAQMLQEIRAIEEEIERCKSPKHLEHLARDELGWGRAKDVILVF